MPPKIYHLHPLVAGALSEWPQHFARCEAMGFNVVCLAPPFRPGASRDIFVTADHEALHPALRWDGSAVEGLAHAARMAADHGLQLWLDLVLDRVSVEAPVYLADPRWFATNECGTPIGWHSPSRPDIAYARLNDDSVARQLGDWWLRLLERLVQAGVAGFRCLEPDHVPAAVWHRIISRLRGPTEDCRFLAWTPGVAWPALEPLQGVGFDHVCSSLAWWDGRASWLVEETAALRRIAPTIASPEPSFAERLAARLAPGSDTASAYRRAIRLAAATANGLFVPMGFEFATRRAFDPATAAPEDFRRACEEAPADFSDEMRGANGLVDRIEALHVDGELRSLTRGNEPVTALLRTDAADLRAASHAVVVLVNPDPVSPAPVAPELAHLPPLTVAETVDAGEPPDQPLAPGEVRVVAYAPAPPVLHRTVADADLSLGSMAARRIAIEAIAPSVADCDAPAKCIVGESVTVSADLIADGHDRLAAAVLWRAADAAEWNHVAMQPVANDRWQASFIPERVGLHEFTVEAWWDVWETYRHELAAKHAAGLDVTLETEEGIGLLTSTVAAASLPGRDALQTVVDHLRDAPAAERIEILLSPATAACVHAVERRDFCTRHAPPLTLMVDRPQAGFASWYEMFPRSATGDAGRHGTFAGVIERLPAISAMGFDVLYFPPIHPIGTTNRKGRNNALRAAPDDVGSPYAIGAAAGGHDAVHPALGTLEDFRALVTAARQHGLEIALDFAIQCSPDHPWLRQHPAWFRWRPDGSMRYAENPPKKYEDIVNPDFFAPAAMPALWLALRDVVLFWIEQGVHILRVDNPHTKPLPFWQWLIADIKGRHPEVLFLSEAFTRPKLMYRLAKVGFSQSYTYFTWRNTKAELTEYLRELTTPPVSDFFRPNFFVNTPDINPPFLQTSGRPGFLIRAALACTLSGLWGMYSGFEICESAPLPGREEYLDSEKYQLRVRDFAAPGNIVAEITALNRIRRAHPALQSHLGVRFHDAHNDQVLFYGKATPDRRDVVLVAVSLDPHAVQEATIELPLWEFGLPDSGGLQATDLMHGGQFIWQGKYQTIRLDPGDLPFAIWHVEAAA